MIYVPAALSGFTLGFSLILAIGAQNAFVLRQGLRAEHALAVALTCALSDAVLISIGVGGIGAAVAALPELERVVRYGGALFLFVYGLLRLRAAWLGGERLDPASNGKGNLWTTLSTCLTLTWLNPHVYLDTVLLIGSVGAHWGENRWFFGLGAIISSFVFFFGLAFGARLLRPMFARPGAWRALEVVIGLIMWLIAYDLLSRQP